MKALILFGPGDLKLGEVEDPSPPPGWVRIRVKRAGICGTDKAFYKGTYKPGKLPLIPGHEIAGVVDEVGKGIDRDIIGRKVTTEINVYCGKCWFCRRGMPSHCPYRQTIGISIDGGMAEYLLTRRDLLHFADDLGFGELALIEPLAAAVEMIEMQRVEEGSRVVVLGAGALGLLAVMVLSTLDLGDLVVVARPGSPKAKLAKELGAHEVLGVDEVFEYVIRNTTEGQGFDYVVEATGSPEGLDLAVKLVRPRGVIAAKSTHGSPTTFDYTALVVKEARIVGSRCGQFEKALELVRTRKLRLERLITEIYPLDRGIEAFEASFRRDSVKIQLEI